MHWGTFLLAFSIFVAIGLLLPIILSSIAEKGRTMKKEEDVNPPSSKPQTLFEQLGGAAAVNAAVDVFYRRVLADAYINRFFEGVDMEKQAAKQKAFLTMAFGGPHNYSGKDMREGHRHLVKMGLNDSHFDHILMHLRATLAELGVGNDLIQQVIDIAESTRNDVLDRDDRSLYEQLGGEAAVNAAVDVFYRRVLADAYIVRFFEGVDMEKQAAKQKAFLTMAFGGPHNYSGKDMREGHRHLIKMGLNDSHFDHILMHLRATLAELGVDNGLIQQVIAIAESTRDDVLDR